MKKIILCTLILAAATVSAGAKSVNILDFGAVPDGTTFNTEAIQKAVSHTSSKHITVEK